MLTIYIAKPRRANFIGSTNKDEFLTDETGSVRFVCIELIDKLNFSYKTEMKIDDVWRQAYSLYKNGEYHETDPPFIIEADPGLIIEIDPPLIM